MVHHARYVTFQLAEVAVPRRLYRAILERIRRFGALQQGLQPPSWGRTRRVTVDSGQKQATGTGVSGGGRYTRVPKARRWSWAKVKWEMSVQLLDDGELLLEGRRILTESVDNPGFKTVNGWKYPPPYNGAAHESPEPGRHFTAGVSAQVLFRAGSQRAIGATLAISVAAGNSPRHADSPRAWSMTRADRDATRTATRERHGHRAED